MKLFLENIGKISKANIDIDGIAVIAGENNTGKSTVAKSLFSVISSFYDIDKKIEADRLESSDEILYRMSHEVVDLKYGTSEHRRLLSYRVLSNYIHKKISEFVKRGDIAYNNLKTTIIDEFSKNDIDIKDESIGNTINNYLKRIEQTLEIPYEKIRNEIVGKQLALEFSNEINNIYTKNSGSIKLSLKNKCIEILIDENDVDIKKQEANVYVNAVYIDDSFIMDGLNYPDLFYINNSYCNNHKDALKCLLSDRGDKNISKSIVFEDRLKNVYNTLSSVVPGNFEFDDVGNSVYRNSDGVVLNMANISAGLKTFIIIKTLLANGAIQEKGVLILDEPEIHLHPKLQLIFAELIVLIQKEFNLHILLSTHSPYFLKAIEVYSKVHKISDKCKYYLTKNMGDNKKLITIDDVSDKTYKIYRLLAEPYDYLHKLEDEIHEI